MVESLLLIALGMMALMGILWRYSVQWGEADIVDAGWAGGIGAAAIYLALVGDGDIIRRVLIAGCAYIWAARLTLHLVYKRVLVPGEDSRYKELRSKWGSKANTNFLWFFQTQALLVAFLSITFYAGTTNQAPFPMGWDVIALLVFALSLFGEAVADRQLEAFRSNPVNRGQVCDVGLWRYSRHPNYFFEWLIWICFFLFAIGSRVWYLALLSPLVMLFLLLKITGIPPNEKRAIQSRGDKYRAYQRRTNAFFPWLPKEGGWSGTRR